MRAVLAGVCLLVAQLGCGLNKVEVPGLSGPAELAMSFQLQVLPDILVADGRSTAAVQVRVRNENGQAVPGQAIFFALTDDGGNFADIGRLSQNTAVTDGGGIAQVIYTSPPRSDATANQQIGIAARPITGDSNGQVYRTVKLELRSAEPRLFPQIPGNKPPICNFVMEPETGFVPGGTDLLAQTTSSDEDGFIVRYHWDFGDGDTADKPDVVHRYAFSGNFKLTHVVTDNGGLQAACQADVFVD